MRPAEFRLMVGQSAKKLYWQEVLDDIKERFEPQFYNLAVETVIYYIPGEIVKQADIEVRRAIIDSIPDDCEPAHAKQLIINGTKVLWKKRNVR